MNSMELRVRSLFLFLFSIITTLLADVTGTPRIDAQKLLSFKGTLPNSRILENWQPNQNPCFFRGVSCRDSRVNEVDLSSSGLNSDFLYVSEFLLSLDYLEKLYLSSANIVGNFVFSSGFHCSKVLTELDLSGNRIFGSISELANLASSCSSLKYLNLSRNELSFSRETESDPLNMDMQKLDLSYNNISGGKGFPWLLSGGCSQLRFFSVEGNKMWGEVHLLSTCVNLEYLSLSSNNFSGEIPSLANCVSLKHLDLSSNSFSGDIKTQFAGCELLNFLNLSKNSLSGEVVSLPSKNLKILAMSLNNFDGEIPSKLADACSTLSVLDLSSNHLVGTIPNEFASCVYLEIVNLSNNNLSGEIPLETLSSMKNLERLLLSSNSFTGSLSVSVSNLPNLQELDLSSNGLYGSIPREMCRNQNNNLKELYLQNNLFTGTIPASLSNCSKLTSLDLSFNYLKGSVPSSLGSLTKLKDLIMWLNMLQGEIPSELGNIKTLENLILDYNGLTGAIPFSISNCTSLNWISLSSNFLTGEIPSWIGRLSNLAILKLSNNSLSGRIPSEIGDCKSLIWLDLNSNRLNGSIPPTLSNQSGKIAGGLITGKRYVYLKNDGSPDCKGAGNLLEFAGIRYDQLNRVPTRHSCNFTRVYMGNTKYTFNNNGSMIFLDLSYNFLEGSIPKDLGQMYYLSVLNLGHNFLSGIIPTELGGLKSVGVLDLSHNNLEGPIPSSFYGMSMLSEIDLSNNMLNGSIPQSGQLATFPSYRYANNSGLCGYPLQACQNEVNSSTALHHNSHRRKASLVGSVAMGLLFALFIVFALILIAMESQKRKKQKEESLDVFMDSRSLSSMVHLSNWKLTGDNENVNINLSTFEKPLQKLTFKDLLEATNGFHEDNLIGSGGFGHVYKAQLKDGTIVAIKKLIPVSGQGDREFVAEMATIGRIRHHNLVPLLGYCKIVDERILVYEYMKYGSLEDVLHDRKKTGIKLNWAARKKIAIGAAKGLAFLHCCCVPHIIHRDMKSSNVLIDENLEARVSDFGMARMMSVVDTHLSVSTLAGTPGYVPPEYYVSFRCSMMGDVYSYGVVLLELLTGRKPTDSPDFGDNNLVGWVRQHARLKITDIFDPELMKEGTNMEIELLQHLKIACACLDDRPCCRPTITEVINMFQKIQSGTEYQCSTRVRRNSG